MSTVGSQQISLFRSQIQNRRFDDETFRILESHLASKDAKSTIEVAIELKQFMRQESLRVVREIAGKPIDHKLMIADFFIRAFDLIGDVESCLALRYEALVMRDQKAASDTRLKVLPSEWLVFAQQSLDHGFYSVARKACERALLYAPDNIMVDPENDDHFHCMHVIQKIRTLYDTATILASTQSVQVHAAEHIKKKTAQQLTEQTYVFVEKPSSGSSLFRKGIKRRNERKLLEHQRMQLDVENR